MSDLVDTAEPRVTDLLRVRPQHLRSIQIERDYPDPDASSHYVVTPFIATTFTRLARSLRANTTARAWRLTGDYGSGKSSLALAFARYAAGALESLPPALPAPAAETRLEPVLVVGEREPVGRSLLRALHQTLARLGRPVPKGAAQSLARADSLSTAVVMEALNAVSRCVRNSGRASGLLVVLDELGKNLEHAAATPDQSDLHLLQALAEAAARSGPAPLVVVAVLHQAVTAYARDLASAERREWEKVSGRYEEIVFAPPLEQSAALTAAALGIEPASVPRALARSSERSMRTAVGAGWYGPGASEADLAGLAPALAPLDPFVLPVLARVLRRFGQNERSLFGFLSSEEPAGLMAHMRQTLAGFEPYRLHNLYDYLAQNFSHSLESGTAGARWGTIDGTVRSGAARNELERGVLKTVGLVNLLEDPSLHLDAGVLASAVASETRRSSAEEAVRRLTAGARVLYERGAGAGLCLWPNTSVDLEAAFEAAAAAIDQGADVIAALRPVLPTEPLVARRHYVETGAIRHFDVVYVPVAGLGEALSAPPPSDADGRVLVALSRNEAERQEALAMLGGFSGWGDTLVVGAPPAVGSLAPLLRDLDAWRRVAEHTPALSGDRMARQEVSRQLAVAEERLKRALAAMLDFRSGGVVSTRWMHQGEVLDIRSGRQLSEALSKVCDAAYDRSPIIRNELLNRRQLSSAAARARTRLIEGLAAASELPALGLDETHMPPEMAVYLSVLKAGNVHILRDGRWRIVRPDPDPLRLGPALDRIAQLLRREEDRRVPYGEIADGLRSAPYGVRDGVIPLLVAVYLAANWHHTAVYEEGTYLEQAGGPEFTRILKESEHFTFQHCAVEGVRTEVFARLAAVVGLQAEAAEPDLLDVVRPLMQFVARLPDHARRTRNLTVTSAAVRNVLMRVQDPSAMLFTDLPRACGLDPFSAAEALDETRLEAFVRAMTTAVRELRGAYPALVERIGDALGRSLETDGPIEGLHATLSRRADRLVGAVAEPELKSFAIRLADRALAPKSWLESIASFLARKPPERWGEADEREFHHRLKLLARRFVRVEAALAEDLAALEARPGEGAYRLVVTGTDGRELEDLVRGRVEDPAVDAIERQFAALLSEHGRIGLLAAARALVALAQTASGEPDATGGKVGP